MQDTPGRRLYLSTAVDSESNFLDRRGRRRRRDRERRNGGGNKRKRKGMPSHRGLSSPTKEDYRICLLVDHHRCRSPPRPSPCLLSSSLSVPLLSRPPSPPAPGPPGSFSFYLRNETQWPLCAAQSFDGNFFVKAHCHLSRSLIRRTYRSSGEKCLRPRDGALFARARDTAGASVFITAVVLNAGQYHPANLIYLKHSQSDHRELLVELIDGGLIKRARKGKSE